MEKTNFYSTMFSSSLGVIRDDYDDYVMIPKGVYDYMRSTLKEYEELSSKLYCEYMGSKDYCRYGSIPMVAYSHLVHILIEKFNRCRKNIFYRIWKRIMKW